MSLRSLLALAVELSSLVADANFDLPHILYVAPDGNDNSSGASISMPIATCAEAVRKVNDLINDTGLPPGGVEVRFLAGTYPLTASTACGPVSFQGTRDTPIVFRSYGGKNGSKANFDATSSLDALALKPVSNATIKALLNPTAREKVLELAVPASAGWTGSQLEWNGVPLTPSVWPNKGLGYVRRVFDKGAVYAEGRTKGPRPQCHICEGSNKSTANAPCGANISLADQPTGDWAAELSAGPGFGSISLSGYFANDWYRETHHVVKVVRSASNTSLQFESYSRYGICEAMEDVEHGCGGSAPGRFTVSGLLSEVDAPGEYFFNAATQMLYIYPFPEANDKVELGFWHGPGLIALSGASYVTVRDVEVSGATSTAISISGGEWNTVGGCTLHNSAGGVSLVGGHHNQVIGNDIYDVSSHIESSGNEGDDLRNLVLTNNFIANNHLTQVYLRGSWQLRIRGMGDRLSHNLIHDASGQLLTPGGPLTMIDHNEIFNTGYAEGDGGVIYSGASLTAGYGMQYRENFIHHSLEVPGLHGRGGIYFDDHEGSVSNCSGNVMYKAAGRAFLVNGGAANNITHNLCINGGIGIYNQHADDMTKDLPLYDNGTLKRGDKGDYIWKTEQSLGVQSFQELFGTLFAGRFPTFKQLLSVNSTTVGWASAAGSNFQHNVFLNNSGGNICLLTSYHGTPENPGEFCDEKLPRPGSPKFIDQMGALEADWSWFPGSANLEFVNASLGFDTGSIGLRCDGWRSSRPVPSRYRPWVKEHFDGVPSTSNGPYTPDAAGKRAGLESGRKLVQEFTEPCPPSVKTDCHAVWLAWGECQADGQQWMRYTIETNAQLGGLPCHFEDGFTQRQSCARPAFNEDVVVI